MPRRLVMDIPWPTGGLDESTSYEQQNVKTYPPKPPTTVNCNNVRAFDPFTGRARGAQRPGLSLYTPTNMGTLVHVKCIDHVAVSAAFGGGADTSTVSRSVKLVCLNHQTLYLVTTSSATAITNNSGSNFNANAPSIHSAQHFGKIYFFDGTTAKLYDPATNTVEAWTASAGSLPSNGANLPTIGCAWRARMVCAGVAGDRQNWFMSAVGNARDFDYAPATTVKTQAVAGNNAIASYCPDIITALIPINDDMLLFLCDHSIWMMRGDPMDGGRIDLVSSTVGACWGVPWCKDASGRIYFFGSRGGVYVVDGGGALQKISQAIDDRLAQVNLATTIVTMAYHDVEQGVYLFLTPTNAPGTNATHYFYDIRTGGMFPQTFNPLGAGNFDPRAVHVYDGDGTADRVLLIGSSSGFLHKIDVDSDDDTGRLIDSHVYLGPIQVPGGLITEMQCTLGENSDPVDFSLFAGSSAAAAYAAGAGTAKFTGTWSIAGKNPSERRRARGSAAFVKLRNATLNKKWSLEKLTVTVQEGGPAARRAF